MYLLSHSHYSLQSIISYSFTILANCPIHQQCPSQHRKSIVSSVTNKITTEDEPNICAYDILLSKEVMFKWVKKFQERMEYDCFKNAQEIRLVIANDQYDKLEGEMSVHLYREDDVRMDVIYCRSVIPPSVRVAVERLTGAVYPIRKKNINATLVDLPEYEFKPKILDGIDNVNDWWQLESAVAWWYKMETIRLHILRDVKGCNANNDMEDQ